MVLRNNRTSAEHPLGIFHPHAEVHHIKQENIGLIEVMGLAVLPARLKQEMHLLGEELVRGTEDISANEELAKHSDWYKMLREKYPHVQENQVHDILKEEIGKVFATVLTHAGVYKRDAEGMAAFDKFMQTVSED